MSTTREEVRLEAEAERTPFLEIHSASIEILAARDVKGLYRQALAGELAHFTGVSGPYVPPRAPDLVVESDREAVEQSLERIVALLVDRGLIAAVDPGEVE